MRRAAQTWLVPFEIVFRVSRFEPALNWNRFLTDLRRGLNCLNSASGFQHPNLGVEKKSGSQMAPQDLFGESNNFLRSSFAKQDELIDGL